MKNQMIRSFLLLVFTSGLSACKKNEQGSQTMETAAPIALVASFVPTKVTNTAGQYFKSIDTICAPYLAFTNLINPATFTDGHHLSLSDGNLVVEGPGGTSYFEILKQHPYGWWNNWNKPPYVENQNPIIWERSVFDGPRTLKLSKKCYVFGFELSAFTNTVGTGPLTFVVKYTNTDQQPSALAIGSISNGVLAPNGARLFAVKSDIPFDQVEIIYSGSPSVEPAWGITNIRYVTDKGIYEKHKND
jgi:hypothetical protein